MRPHDKKILITVSRMVVVLWLLIAYLVYIQGFVKSLPYISIVALVTVMYFLCRAQAKIDTTKENLS